MLSPSKKNRLKTRNMILVVIVYILLLSLVGGGAGLSKFGRYANAKKYLEECNYEQAIEVLQTLSGYQDADSLLEYAMYMQDGKFADWIKKNQIKEFVVPKDITIISSEAFCGCDSLVSVTLPAGVEVIKSRAFSDCRNLVYINIPDGVETIGYQAFYDCISLTEITLPDSLISIANRAFYGCTRLKKITFNGTAQQWGEVEKGTYWSYNVPAALVICKNGSVQIL